MLTVTTGLVDAVSILALGRVFVANMTGNVVFIGFALAGAPGFSLWASALALVAFLAGAGAGGVLVGRLSWHRGRLLLVTTALECVLLAVAAVVLGSARPSSGGAQAAVVVVCAVALGLQNAAVRALAVPDLTTTVLTMSLTGIAADLRDRQGRAAARRALSVLTMAAGAVVGALLVERGHAALVLSAAAVLVGLVVVALAVSVRRGASWHRPSR